MERLTLTAKQAARRLGVTERTIFRWRDAGRLREAPRAGRTVMFWAADVEALAGGGAQGENLSMADVYRRLTEARTRADVEALRQDVGAALGSMSDNAG